MWQLIAENPYTSQSARNKGMAEGGSRGTPGGNHRMGWSPPQPIEKEVFMVGNRPSIHNKVKPADVTALSVSGRPRLSGGARPRKV
jgi:hypothetical protein